jgi:hypothetical protein
MPDGFYRLLALPNGIALIALGYSLWSTAHKDMTVQPAAVRSRSVRTAGAG